MQPGCTLWVNVQSMNYNYFTRQKKKKKFFTVPVFKLTSKLYLKRNSILFKSYIVYTIEIFLGLITSSHFKRLSTV